MRILKLYPLLILALWYSCTSVQHISTANVSYTIPSTQTNAHTDASITAMVEPYKSQLDGKMSEVIANVGTELSKKQPESTLGNFATDAMMAGVKREGLTADFAVCNYGGLRVPVITSGPLLMGEVYELSPFDNTIVIVNMPGNVVDTFFQYIAAKNGWPVSGNVRMTMKDGKMTKCMINGKALDPNKTYNVATIDYVANGGDDARFMIGLDRVQTGFIFRDMIIQYAAETARMGNDINVSIEGRIVKE